MNTEGAFGQLRNGKTMGLSGQFGVQSDSFQKHCEDCGPDLHLLENESKRLCKVIISNASNLPFIAYLTWSDKGVV